MFLRFWSPMWLMGLRLVGGFMVHSDVFLCVFVCIWGGALEKWRETQVLRLAALARNAPEYLFARFHCALLGGNCVQGWGGL